MKQYLKYTGDMLPHVIDFVGQENIIAEPHSNVGVMGYFLTDNNISDRKMFCDRMYIIKDLETGNISLDYRKPANAILVEEL